MNNEKDLDLYLENLQHRANVEERSLAEVMWEELKEILIKDRGKTNEINILVEENRELRSDLERIQSVSDIRTSRQRSESEK